MGENSKIQWTTHTGNLWFGCTETWQAGCDHCYARELDRRWGSAHWGNRSPRQAVASVWNNLTKWQREAAKNGSPAKVFVGSMMDWLEVDRPLVNHKGEPLEQTTADLRDRLLNEIEAGLYPDLIFQFLSKRPERFDLCVPDEWRTEGPPSNCWIGTSVADQRSADVWVPHLLEIPAKVRFLSAEPLIGPVDLRRIHLNGEVIPLRDLGISWVIVGGESGPQARPLEVKWVESLVQQCREAGAKPFVKQLGSVWAKRNHARDSKGDDIDEWPEHLRVREFPV